MKEKKEKIIFVLNTLGITGGVKVIFEHANKFSEKGYDVEIVHLLKLRDGVYGMFIACLKKIKYIFGSKRPEWFCLHDAIKVSHYFSLNRFNSGIIIATANETARWVNKLQFKDIKKFYFIQDYEIWTRSKNLVDKTYKYPLKKIVISSWLKDLLKNKFQESSMGPVFNGVDYNKFFYFKNKNKNNLEPINVLIMYHILSKKGFNEGAAALKLIKKKVHNIKITSFGAYPLNEKFNDLIDEFYYKPSPDKLRKIYGQADIFLCSSNQEGFTLPPMEAMCAQCAIVSTRVGGPIDYCIDNETALLVPVGDIELMAESIIKLVNNKSEIFRISLNGQREIKKFTWDAANNLLEDILLNN